jgi:SSS family solute:Na+ symporter
MGIRIPLPTGIRGLISAALIAIVIAVLVARPLVGGSPQAFQYIQEFTGFFTPGICAIFILGVFWNKATANGALLAALGSFSLSIGGKLLPTVPLMDRVGYVFPACCAIMFVDALMERKVQSNAVNLSEVNFTSSTGYWIGSDVVVVGPIGLYGTFWYSSGL